MKENATVEVTRTVLEETAEMKNLGLIITSTLSWTEKATNRSAKAPKALCSVKRNISKKNNKDPVIKIIQIICCTYSRLWLIIMETLKKRTQNI